MKKRIEFDCKKFESGAQPVYFEFDSLDGVLRDGAFGVGEVRYEEGSVYRGTLIYRNGKFNKYGYGEQDFTKAHFSSDELGVTDAHRPYKYVGAFDYTVTDWIYGNGVMYFIDMFGKPSGYATGWYVGLTKRGEYRGAFNRELLLAGYENTPELELHPRLKMFEARRKKAKKTAEAKSVIIGDSWFELYETGGAENGGGTFAEDTIGKNVLGLGIGGTTYSDWVNVIDDILGGIKFEQVFFNLGYNDIHGGEAVADVMMNLATCIAAVKSVNPQALIYVNAVCPAPFHPATHEQKTQFNKQAQRMCQYEKNVKFLHCNVPFLNQDGSAIDDLADYFIDDKIHLNEKGYRLWAPYFAQYF